ncbi:hypothetical protein MATL_G00004790 [Megalops atlanticus]|uniref:GRAM domain-containing protein n=1 Tax=Megalops atlanticus TaxID=7932 RepID=A0A9D3TD80_MEGAT|nr:hypothetical protein MATL_G00004790 [Megalops atlanticus]
MALNRNHSRNGGVLINNGESVLSQCTDVELSFSNITSKTELLRGTKKGTVYLTPYRMVFLSKNAKDSLGSVMFPFYLMKGCSIEQPAFSANYIRGMLYAEPGGGWEGKANFKIAFLSGGAIDFGQYLFKVATNASRSAKNRSTSYGYPSTGEVNGCGPPKVPHSYPYVLQHNNFYQGPHTTQGIMGYSHPTASSGVFPSIPTAPVYMLQPPPYPGPPQNWTAPENPKPAEAAPSAYYNPKNPYNVYMPMEPPPPYAPYPHFPEKETN